MEKRAYNDIPEEHNDRDFPNSRNVYSSLLLHVWRKILLGREIDTHHATMRVSPDRKQVGGEHTLSAGALETYTLGSGRP